MRHSEGSGRGERKRGREGERDKEGSDREGGRER